MNYVLVKLENEVKVFPYKGSEIDQVYDLLENLNINICGIFGREEYAQAWKNFYNNNIDVKELNKLLDSVKE